MTISKYAKRGAYHVDEYHTPGTVYRHHVDDLAFRIRSIIPHHSWIHEVGCGEGVVLEKLKSLYRVSGNDCDKEAVRLGNLIYPDIKIELCDDITTVENTFDAVMFADSLEHIDSYEDHIFWAQQSKFVVVAIPDRHDPHAVRDIKPNDIEELFSDQQLRFKSRRHARYFWIYQCAT